MNVKELRKTLLVFSAAVLGITALAVLTIQFADLSRKEIPVYSAVPAFQLQDQNGTPFTEKNLRGKITVLDFFFTRCPGACPVMSKQLEELYKLYASSDKVQFVSITVDPQHDTPDVLRDYAKDHSVVDDRWKFLRGDIQDVITLSEKGCLLPAENLPAGHSTKFVLIDQDAQIRGYFESGEPASLSVLKSNIRELARPLMAQKASTK